MTRNSLNFVFLIAIIVMMGACGNNVWDDLPEPIVKMVCEYFPGGEVASYVDTDNGSVVKIRNGAELTFDSDYQWVKVDGCGQTVPQQFLFDQLPREFYEYFEALESDSDVYCVSREGRNYTVELLDATVQYDGNTGTVTYPDHTLQGVFSL